MFELRRCITMPLGLLVALSGAPALADDTPPATPQATIRTITAESLAALRVNKAAVRKDPAGV
ncbi:MAG: hypothetical protein WAL92_01905, partial [Thiogranum sp.]